MTCSSRIFKALIAHLFSLLLRIPIMSFLFIFVHFISRFRKLVTDWLGDVFGNCCVYTELNKRAENALNIFPSVYRDWLMAGHNSRDVLKNSRRLGREKTERRTLVSIMEENSVKLQAPFLISPSNSIAWWFTTANYNISKAVVITGTWRWLLSFSPSSRGRRWGRTSSERHTHTRVQRCGAAWQYPHSTELESRVDSSWYCRAGVSDNDSAPGMSLASQK